MKNVLQNIFWFVFRYFVSWATTIGMIWLVDGLISGSFHGTFNMATATGIWLVLVIVEAFVRYMNYIVKK